VFLPASKHPILIRLVAEQLGLDAVFTGRLQGFCRVIDLHEDIEKFAALFKLKVTVGLLAVFSDRERQPAIAVRLQDPNVGHVACDQRMHDGLGGRHRVLEPRGGDLGNRRANQFSVRP